MGHHQFSVLLPLAVYLLTRRLQQQTAAQIPVKSGLICGTEMPLNIRCTGKVSLLATQKLKQCMLKNMPAIPDVQVFFPARWMAAWCGNKRSV